MSVIECFDGMVLVDIACCLLLKMCLCRCQDDYCIQSCNPQVTSVFTLGMTPSCLQMIP